MEWLTNLLGMGGGSSPFGMLGQAMAGPNGTPGAPGSSVAGPMMPPAGAPGSPMAGPPVPPAGSNPLQGLLKPQGNGFALNQAANLIKGPQMQPPPQMNLLSGPRQPTNPFAMV